MAPEKSGRCDEDKTPALAARPEQATTLGHAPRGASETDGSAAHTVIGRRVTIARPPRRVVGPACGRGRGPTRPARKASGVESDAPPEPDLGAVGCPGPGNVRRRPPEAPLSIGRVQTRAVRKAQIGRHAPLRPPAPAQLPVQGAAPGPCNRRLRRPLPPR